jgi:hypothetical protein
MTKTRFVMPSSQMFSWKHDVPIRRERIAVHLIILCDVKNSVGIIKILRNFCRSRYTFSVLEHLHCKNLSTTDK